jgi:tRNA nucleotidyltransferase/poly(A) polymerase
VSRTAHSLTHPSSNSILRSLPSSSRSLLDVAVAAAEARGESLWLVGGAIRDYAAGRSVWNVDVSVDGDAAALADEMVKSLDATVQYFRRFAANATGATARCPW